jgi:hypothetical protein|tara:strand:- start:370 stop:972 length:603 start_codon:yes stop_codon:yes gene_type:complete
MDINDFVFEKENAFTNSFCDSIVEDFELCDAQNLTLEGYSGKGIDYNTKRTRDLNFLTIPELKKKYSNIICSKFNKYLMEDYLNLLPHQDKFPGSNLFFGETYYECLQVQRYKKNEGHYNAWHIETGNFDMSKRLFVFILYLSDVFEGGETELLYSGKKTTPRKGKLMIAPSTFPYVHKGHMPLDNDKHILTTWLSFTPK